MLDLSARITRAEHIEYRDLGDAAMLYDPTKDALFGLSPTGVQIWQLLASGSTAHDIISALSHTFDVSSDECTSEVTAFLDLMLTHDLIVRS